MEFRLATIGPEPRWRDYDKSALKEYNDILAGKLYLKDASRTVQSWFELMLFTAACEISRMKTRDERRAAVAAMPETCRAELVDMCKKVWSQIK
jgi:hypothetical protein